MYILQHIYYYPSIVNSTILWCTFPMVIKTVNNEPQFLNHKLLSSISFTCCYCCCCCLLLSAFEPFIVKWNVSVHNQQVHLEGWFFASSLHFSINNTVNMINAELVGIWSVFLSMMLFINFSLYFFFFLVINLNHMSKNNNIERLEYHTPTTTL